MLADPPQRREVRRVDGGQPGEPPAQRARVSGSAGAGSSTRARWVRAAARSHGGSVPLPAPARRRRPQAWPAPAAVAGAGPRVGSVAMTTRRILATSGGFLPSADRRWNARVPGRTVLTALRLSGKDRPRVLLLETAAGDSDSNLALKYQALSRVSLRRRPPGAVPMPNQPVEQALGRADVVWVGGGSVANLLACWRVHEVDVAMRDAWERGVVLAGVSAGSICWHASGTTDSYGPDLRAVTDGSACCRTATACTTTARSSAARSCSPRRRRHAAGRTAPTTASACCTRADPVEVITDIDVDPLTGPGRLPRRAAGRPGPGDPPAPRQDRIGATVSAAAAARSSSPRPGSGCREPRGGEQQRRRDRQTAPGTCPDPRSSCD